MKSLLSNHSLRCSIGLQLKSHPLLAMLDDAAHEELAALLWVQEGHRGERLLEQGGHVLLQFFVIEGMLKRVVANAEGREMTLRFAGERDMESCYEAWQQRSVAGFSVVCAKRALVACLPVDRWCAFLERHPAAMQRFQQQMVMLGAAIANHAVGLLLLDAPGRVQAFSSRHPDLLGRLPQKDLASYLNLSAETLCRLTRQRDRTVYCCP